MTPSLELLSDSNLRCQIPEWSSDFAKHFIFKCFQFTKWTFEQLKSVIGAMYSITSKSKWSSYMYRTVKYALWWCVWNYIVHTPSDVQIRNNLKIPRFVRNAWTLAALPCRVWDRVLSIVSLNCNRTRVRRWDAAILRPPPDFSSETTKLLTPAQTGW